MKKCVLENFPKFTGKHLRFAKFSGTPFLQNTSAAATLLKWGSVWKTSDEYSLTRNTNLKSTVQVYHFFLGSINFQCMFLLVYTVNCQKLPPEYRCSVRKGVLKIHRKTQVTGLTPILKNIYQRLLLHYTHTTRCCLSVLLYSTPFSSSLLLLLIQ